MEKSLALFGQLEQASAAMPNLHMEIGEKLIDKRSAGSMALLDHGPGRHSIATAWSCENNRGAHYRGLTGTILEQPLPGKERARLREVCWELESREAGVLRALVQVGERSP